MPNHPARLLAGCTNNTWAIRQEALLVLRQCAAGDLTAEEARERMGLQTVDAEPDSERPGSVAVIPLQGIITPNGSYFGGGGLRAFRAALQEAVNDASIASILIDIDSPGGYVSLVDETAAAVRAAREVKPILAIANTLAASAAYYIGSQANELIVTPSGVVGSIGVFNTHEDWSAYDERLGVKTTLISAGEFKTEGNAYEPLSDEARAAMQGEVDKYYEQFLAAVAAGRRVDVETVRETYGKGRCMLAADALDAGMVDSVATFEQVVERMIAGDLEDKPEASAASAAAAFTALADASAAPDFELRPVVLERAGTMRHASFAAETRASAPTGAGQGIAWVTGNASVFGSRNTFGEVFVPGAFIDCVTNTANPLPMVDQHRQAIGSWRERTEDISTLALAGPISDTQAGRDVATLLEDEALNGLSVAFLPLEVYLAAPGETFHHDTPYGPWSCTHDAWTLYVIRAMLGEVSIVYAPSDDEARITSVGSMSADQLGTALPGLRADAAWEDVAWSMCRLMGAPGAGLTGLQPEERQSLHQQLRAAYAAHGKTPPVFAANPDYRGTTFHADEPALYQDRSLGKRCADVAAAIGGTSGRPLSDGTRTRAIQARDAINRLLDPEQPEDTHDLDLAAVAAELERTLSSLES